MIITEYFLNSSLHGFHFLSDKRFHWIERLFWAICVVLSWLGSVILMLYAIKEYRTRGINFVVDTSYLKWETNFPSIIFCEKNSSKLYRHEKEWFSGSTRFKAEMIRKVTFFRGRFDIKECDVGAGRRPDCITGNYSFYMQQLNSKCSEIFSSCYYNDKQFHCCDEFFSIESFYGPCYAVNSIINSEFPNYLPFKIKKDSHSFGNLSIELFTNEVTVSALSQDSVPSRNNGKSVLLDSDSSNSALKKMRNIDVFLSVKATSTVMEAKRINISRRGCKFYDENDLITSKIYSLSACENECLRNLQLSICNCALHTLPGTTLKEECNLDGLLCASTTMNMTEDCGCINSCFETEINSLGFSHSTMKQFQYRNKKSLLRMNFIVNLPTLRIIRTVVKTPLDVIVSVGGAAGLFVGASLLAVVEIIYYFCVRPYGNKYLKEYRKKKLGKKNVPKLFVH